MAAMIFLYIILFVGKIALNYLWGMQYIQDCVFVNL